MWTIDPNMSYLTEDVICQKWAESSVKTTKPILVLGSSERKDSTEKLKINTISNVYANLAKTDEEIKSLNQNLFKYINTIIDSHKNIVNEDHGPKSEISNQIPAGESSGVVEEHFDRVSEARSSCRYFRPCSEENPSVCNVPPATADLENVYDNFSIYLRSEGIDITNPTCDSQNEELVHNELICNPPPFDDTDDTTHISTGTNISRSKSYDKHSKGMFDETFPGYFRLDVKEDRHHAANFNNSIDATSFFPTRTGHSFTDSVGKVTDENVHRIEPPLLFRPYENIKASALPPGCNDRTASSVGFQTRYEFVRPEEIVAACHAVKNRTDTQDQDVRTLFIEDDQDVKSGYRSRVDDSNQRDSQDDIYQADDDDDSDEDYEDRTYRPDEMVLPGTPETDRPSLNRLSSTVISEQEKRVLIHQEQYYQDYYKMLRARSGSVDDVRLYRLPVAYNSNDLSCGCDGKKYDTPEKEKQELQDLSFISRSKRQIDEVDTEKDTICQNILKRYDQYKKSIVSEIPKVQETDSIDSNQISSQVIKETQPQVSSCKSDLQTYGEYKRNSRDSSKHPNNVKALHGKESAEIPDNEITSEEPEETKVQVVPSSSNVQTSLTYGEYKRGVKKPVRSHSNAESFKDKDKKDFARYKISYLGKEETQTRMSTDNCSLPTSSTYGHYKKGVHISKTGSYVKEKQTRILPVESSDKEDKIKSSARALMNIRKNRSEDKNVADRSVSKSRDITGLDRHSRNKAEEHKETIKGSKPNAESTYKTNASREVVSFDRRKSNDNVSQKWDPLKSRYGRRPGQEDKDRMGEVSTNPFNPFCPDKGIEKEKPVANVAVQERDPASTLTAIFEMGDKMKLDLKAKRYSSNRSTGITKVKSKDLFKKSFKKLKVEDDFAKDVKISDPAVSSTNTLDFNCEDITSNKSKTTISPERNDSKDCEATTSSDQIKYEDSNETISTIDNSEKESASKDLLTSDIKVQVSEEGIESDEIHLAETSTDVHTETSTAETTVLAETSTDVHTETSTAETTVLAETSTDVHAETSTAETTDLAETSTDVHAETSTDDLNSLNSNVQIESQSELQEKLPASSSPNPQVSDVEDNVNESSENRCEGISQTCKSENNIEGVGVELAGSETTDCDNTDVLSQSVNLASITESQDTVTSCSDSEEKLPENRISDTGNTESADEEQRIEIKSPQQICKNRICKLILVDIFWKAKRDGKFKKSKLQRLTRKFMKKYNSKLKTAQSILARKTVILSEVNDPGPLRDPSQDELTEPKSPIKSDCTKSGDNELESSTPSKLTKESYGSQVRTIKKTTILSDSEEEESIPKVVKNSSNEERFNSDVSVTSTEVSCSQRQNSENVEPNVAVDPVSSSIDKCDQGQMDYSEQVIESEIIKDKKGEPRIKIKNKGIISTSEVIKNEEIVYDCGMNNETENVDSLQDFEAKKNDPKAKDEAERSTSGKLKIVRLKETSKQKSGTSQKKQMGESKRSKKYETFNEELERSKSQVVLSNTTKESPNIFQTEQTGGSDNIKKKSLLETVSSKEQVEKKGLEILEGTSQFDPNCTNNSKIRISQDMRRSKSENSSSSKDEKCVFKSVRKENKSKHGKILKETSRVICDETRKQESDISCKKLGNSLKPIKKDDDQLERKNQTKKKIEEISEKTSETISYRISDDANKEKADITQTEPADKPRNVKKKKESTHDFHERNLKSKHREKSKETTQFESFETNKKRSDILQDEFVDDSESRKKYCGKDIRPVDETVCYGKNEKSTHRTDRHGDDRHSNKLIHKLDNVPELRVSLIDIKKYHNISDGSVKLTAKSPIGQLQSGGFKESLESRESDFDGAKCLFVTSSNETQENPKSVAYNFLYNFGTDTNTEEAGASDMAEESPLTSRLEVTNCDLPIDEPAFSPSAPLPVIENALSEINKSLLEIDKTPNTLIDESSNSSNEDFPFLKNLDSFLTNLSKLDTDDNRKRSDIPCGSFSDCRGQHDKETSKIPDIIDSHIDVPSTSRGSTLHDASQCQVTSPNVKTKAELKAQSDFDFDADSKKKNSKRKANMGKCVSAPSTSSSSTELLWQTDETFLCVYCRKQFSSSKRKTTETYSKRISLFCETCFVTVYKKRFVNFKRKCKLNSKKKRV